MDYRIATEYYNAITVIEAQQRLVEMNIADYPRMKSHDRKNFYNRIKKAAHPEEMQKKMDFDEFFKVMGHG